MANVSQDRAAMNEAVTLTRDAFDEINGIRATVVQRKAELQATWQGNASMSFGRVVDEWDRKCMVVLDALNDLAEGLGAARTSYEVTEEQQEAAVNAVEEILNES